MVKLRHRYLGIRVDVVHLLIIAQYSLLHKYSPLQSGPIPSPPGVLSVLNLVIPIFDAWRRALNGPVVLYQEEFLCGLLPQGLLGYGERHLLVVAQNAQHHWQRIRGVIFGEIRPYPCQGDLFVIAGVLYANKRSTELVGLVVRHRDDVAF
ncbi:hypothetical protein J3458_021751 [Metarhizium acridum]|uniref:uncharacterized protein n=1 Tax=Metarhizium acridum TaxID=92637 RepID=UPI001C6C3716|nr:hypothetical protein J3458_021751 [Metarhizium acridum]